MRRVGVREYIQHAYDPFYEREKCSYIESLLTNYMYHVYIILFITFQRCDNINLLILVYQHNRVIVVETVFFTGKGQCVIGVMPRQTKGEN